MVYRQIQRKSRCLDINGGFKKNGTPVIMWPCHSGPNQKFAYNRKTHQLRNKMTRKCVGTHHGVPFIRPRSGAREVPSPTR